MTWSPGSRAALTACAAAVTACSSVHVTRGLPTVAKSPDGHLIRGTEGSPDLERGNQARLAGRFEDAERDLVPLAELGYPDAQMYLAAIYAQREAPEAQDTAIQWYRKALPRRPEVAVPLARVLMHRGDRASVEEAEHLLLIVRRRHRDPSTDAALLELYGLYPQFDIKHQAPSLARAAAEAKLPELRIAAIGWYRASLDMNGNAQRLLELCKKNLDIAPSCYVDLALYYRYAQQHQPLQALVQRALKAWEDRPPLEQGLEPIALERIASRLAISMVDQPSDDAVEDGADDDLELQKEAQAQIETAQADEDVDAKDDARLDGQPPTTNASPSAPTASNALPELADKILRWMLKQPGAMPTEAAGVAASYPYLLPDVDLEKVLQAGVAANVPRASLFLGQLYYLNLRAPRNAPLGEASLRRSLLFLETSIPGHYRLGRLYQLGYLGRPEPQKALDNFLYAARRRLTTVPARRSTASTLMSSRDYRKMAAHQS
jgi:hypothetical protein